MGYQLTSNPTAYDLGPSGKAVVQASLAFTSGAPGQETLYCANVPHLIEGDARGVAVLRAIRRGDEGVIKVWTRMTHHQRAVRDPHPQYLDGKRAGVAS